MLLPDFFEPMLSIKMFRKNKKRKAAHYLKREAQIKAKSKLMQPLLLWGRAKLTARARAAHGMKARLYICAHIEAI